MIARSSGERSDRILLDVGRLVWRRWSGRLPTGIDRVCLAYATHFAPRADVVIRWKGRRVVLSGADARRVLDLLIADPPRFRARLIIALAVALPRALRHVPRRGQLYLDVGHTGLNDPRLVGWIAATGVCAVPLIHDLIPIEMPEYCRPGEGARHGARMANALAGASGVLANSQATLSALRRFADTRGLPFPPALAAPLGGEALRGDAAPAVMDRPYFVMLGTIEGRKNHLLLLHLWRRLAEMPGSDAPRLVLVGQRGWEAQGAFAMLDRCPALRGLVVERGKCSDGELAALLKGARALLMPSFAEGFGMPVIEALQLGTPVIASDLPVFHEIAGTIPTYISPFDGMGWERAVLDFCTASPERARQITALKDLRVPDWPQHFRAVERWLEMLPS